MKSNRRRTHVNAPHLAGRVHSPRRTRWDALYNAVAPRGRSLMFSAVAKQRRRLACSNVATRRGVSLARRAITFGSRGQTMVDVHILRRPNGPCVNSQGRPTGAPGPGIPKLHSPNRAIIGRHMTNAPMGLAHILGLHSRGSLRSPLAIDACPFGAFRRTRTVESADGHRPQTKPTLPNTRSL
jgi:hypothetical protein